MAKIHNYLAKPRLDPLEEKKTFSSLYLGVELELEIKSSLQIPLDKTEELLKDFVIMKNDGSLPQGASFEICSRPATLEIHKKTWQTFFQDEEIQKNLMPTKACGMHVHINRDQLSDLQIGKIVFFVQSKENRKFIRLIA